MKRILAAGIAVLSLISLAACNKDADPDVYNQEERERMQYETRTSAFYGKINPDCFWYTGEVTTGTSTYNYTQVVDSDSVTTVEDYTNDYLDGYVIYDTENQLLHSLDLSAKKYDTKKTANGVDFLFGQNKYTEFTEPVSTTDAAVLDGTAYYCEIFTVLDENGSEIGENKYYFDGDFLAAIEWYENGTLVSTLKINEYSNTNPDDIYVSLPEDFKAGTYTAETVVDPWADKE